MKRIFVLLTDRVPSGFQADLMASDLVLVGHNLEFSHATARVQKIGMPTAAVQRQLAVQVAAALTSEPEPANELLLSISNEVYSYVLRPLVAVVEEALAQAGHHPEAELIVVHSRRISRDIPLAGFATTESPRGSRSLLGAYIAGQLARIPEFAARANFVEVAGDILCRERMRVLMLRALDLVVRIKFSLGLVLMGLLRPRLRAAGEFSGDAILLVRAFHQARFARRLCDAADDCRFETLMLPQFLQGGLVRTLRTLIPLVGESRSSIPTFRDVLMANLQARGDRRLLRDFANPGARVELEIAGRQLSLEVEGLPRELSNLSILLVYRRLLASLLKRRGVRNLVNFELVGRIAGLDRLAADDAGCKLSTVQTALVSEVVHPAFPHAHVFLADGPQTADRLAEIGVLKRGVVEYAGSPVPVSPLRSPAAPRVLAFFTQPYELETTRSIITALVEFCAGNGCRLLVKAHPRDESDYRDVLGGDPTRAAMVDRDIDPEELLAQCDVSITRTSSVARESLALGRPIILCLWSDFDKGIRVDYAEAVAGANHRAHCKQELFSLLNNEIATFAAAEELRTRLFGDLQTHDLAYRICSR